MRGLRTIGGIRTVGRGGGAALQYWQKVAGGLIQYVPVWDTFGTTAVDISNGRNGSWVGTPQLADTAFLTGNPVATFSGDDLINLYSTSLRDAFNGQEGSVFVWGKFAGWTDTTYRRIITITVDGNNYLTLRRDVTNNRLTWEYVAGGVAKTNFVDTSTINWFSLCLTWSKSADQLKFYFNGLQPGATVTGLGAWSGAIGTAALGSRYNTVNQPWVGNLAHCRIYNRALTPGEVSVLSTPT